MYAKQIEQLVVLQQLDKQIIALECELENAPRELASLEEEHRELANQKDQILEKIDYLKAQQKRLAEEIDEDNLKVKKSKNKLMMATNTREYHAMMREMDNLEKLNRMREEENLTLAEELTRQDESLGELDQQVATKEEELSVMRESLDKRLNVAQKRLDNLNKQRKAAGKQVPPPILSRYEFIRSRLNNPVIVSVETGICSGCNISIPPQTYNELQKGKQIHSCPNCQRLIYWCEHLPEEQAEQEPEAQAG